MFRKVKNKKNNKNTQIKNENTIKQYKPNSLNTN